MSRRPDVYPASVSKSSAPTPVWENPKVKMGAILLVTIVAGWFLYRTVRKRQVVSETQSKLKEPQQWQSNFDAPPRPRPTPSRPPPARPVKAAPPRQTNIPNANNIAPLPQPDVGSTAGSGSRMVPENTRPVREKGFAEMPKADLSPTSTAPSDDGFTEL